MDLSTRESGDGSVVISVVGDQPAQLFALTMVERASFIQVLADTPYEIEAGVTG
jgi:hypothetical protein